MTDKDIFFVLLSRFSFIWIWEFMPYIFQHIFDVITKTKLTVLSLLGYLFLIIYRVNHVFQISIILILHTKENQKYNNLALHIYTTSLIQW